MGLHMMKLTPRLSFTFLTPFLLVNFMGCEKNNGEPVDYGPEVQEEKVTETLISVVPHLMPEDIKVGQFVHESHSQEIAQTSVAIVSDKFMTVLEREDFDEAIGVNIREHTLYYKEGGQYQKESREGPLYFARTTTPSLSALSALSDLPARSAFSKVSLHASSDSQTRVTFHRLTTREEEVAPPPLVRKQADCGGLPSCKIRVRIVTYDAVVWSSSQGDRIRIEYKFSPDVPFFTGRLYGANSDGNFIPGLMSQCITQLVQIPKSQSKVLVKECTQLENFRFEPAPES